MSLRELDIVSREFKNPRDVTVIRKDTNLYDTDLQKVIKPLLDEIQKIAKKEKKTKTIILVVQYE